MFYDLKLIIRTIRKKKFYSAVNILGLTTGLLVMLVTFLLISNETSYENIHTNADRIFRVTMHNHADQYDMHWARVDREYVNRLEQEIPEVESLIRFQDYHPRDVKVRRQAYRISHAYSTDPEVFKVFDFELLRGNPEKALSEPRSVVLTRETARNWFGTENILGEEVKFMENDSLVSYTVTGIMRDLPDNTHLPVNLLTSFPSPEARTGWAYVYLLLNNASDANKVSGYFPELVAKQDPDDAGKISFPLQPVKDIHLHSNLAREITPNSNLRYLMIFLLAGSAILILSGVNYMNLQLARAIGRKKMESVKKVLGNNSGRLIRYMLLESTTLATIASLFAIGLFIILQPKITNVVDLAVPGPREYVLLVLSGIAFAVICTLYPLIVQLKSQPMNVLQGRSSSGSQRFGLRNILVGIQMIISLMVISGAMVLEDQFRYMLSGSEQEDQIVVLREIPKGLQRQFDVFANSVSQHPGVEGIAQVMEVPSREIRDAGSVTMDGSEWAEGQAPVLDIQIVGDGFFSVMESQFVAGHTFSSKKSAPESMPEDLVNYLENEPREYILNETAVAELGLKTPGDAIGRNMTWSIGGITLQEGPIVGVIEDYHQESLRNRIDPLVLVQEPVWVRNVLIRTNGSQISSVIRTIESEWKELAPDAPLDLTFMDDLYALHYASERNQLVIIGWYSFLAVLIAFLGILGLLIYMIRAREKELAIRRVLGADRNSLGMLLTQRLIIIFCAGCLAGIPLTWYLLDFWLRQYAYRVNITILPFLAGLAGIGIVLLLTTAVILRRLKGRNPTDVLSSE